MVRTQAICKQTIHRSKGRPKARTPYFRTASRSHSLCLTVIHCHNFNLVQPCIASTCGYYGIKAENCQLSSSTQLQFNAVAKGKFPFGMLTQTYLSENCASTGAITG